MQQHVSEHKPAAVDPRRRHRERGLAHIGDRDPNLAALADPDFCARLDQRLSAESAIDPATGCRIWEGGTGAGGYGMISFRGVMLRLHRLIAIREGRAEPEDPEVRHSCDTPACIEAKHLSGGTHAQNHRDAAMRNRHALGSSGFRGVYFDGSGATVNRWRAYVTLARRNHFIGRFSDPEVAAARSTGARKCLGLVGVPI